jgi:flagellar basal-body rod protein FlgB
MLKSIFNNIGTMEKALDASWLKNEAISSNIANVDTPNYKRKDVEFENFLSEAIGNRKLKMRITNEKHIGSPDMNNFNVNITTDASQDNMRLDGNNVDIDSEMSLLAKNTIYYQFVSQRINSKLGKIKNTINDIK